MKRQTLLKVLSIMCIVLGVQLLITSVLILLGVFIPSTYNMVLLYMALSVVMFGEHMDAKKELKKISKQ